MILYDLGMGVRSGEMPNYIVYYTRIAPSIDVVKLSHYVMLYFQSKMFFIQVVQFCILLMETCNVTHGQSPLLTQFCTKKYRKAEYVQCCACFVKVK